MKKLTLLFLGATLSGCSLLSGEEQLDLYTLKAAEIHPSKSSIPSLAIDVPTAESSLATARIAVTPSSYSREYLSGGEWPDILPKIFQESLVEYLTQRWGGNLVNRLDAGLQTKYVLRSDIEDFSVYDIYGDKPHVRVKVLFRLIDLRERRVYASHTFITEVMPEATTMKEIVKAFNSGLNILYKKAVIWMESEFKKTPV